MRSFLINTTSVFLLTILCACGGGGGGGDSDSPDLSSAQLSVPFLTSFSLVEADLDEYVLPLDPSSSYSVTILGFSGTGSNAVALNDDGVVAGNYFKGPGLTSGYRWQNGSFETVIESGQVTSVSESGTIVGWEDSPFGASGFLSAGTSLTVLDLVNENKLYSANSHGEMVGLIETEEQDFAFWTDGVEVSTFADSFNGYANLINEAGLVVLHENLAGGAVAPAIYDNGTITRLETYGGQFTCSRDVNLHGEIVGWAMLSPTVCKAVMWSDGELIDLTPPGESHCAAVGINDSSDVVIKCQDGTGGGSKAYFWPGDGALTQLDFPGVTGITPNALNNHGQIAGWLTTEDREVRSFLATPR